MHVINYLRCLTTENIVHFDQNSILLLFLSDEIIACVNPLRIEINCENIILNIYSNSVSNIRFCSLNIFEKYRIRAVDTFSLIYLNTYFEYRLKLFFTRPA